MSKNRDQMMTFCLKFFAGLAVAASFSLASAAKANETIATFQVTVSGFDSLVKPHKNLGIKFEEGPGTKCGHRVWWDNLYPLPYYYTPKVEFGKLDVVEVSSSRVGKQQFIISGAVPSDECLMRFSHLQLIFETEDHGRIDAMISVGTVFPDPTVAPLKCGGFDSQVLSCSDTGKGGNISQIPPSHFDKYNNMSAAITLTPR